MSAPKRQTKEDREYILANLPGGVRRVQVIEPNGKQVYKRPDDVDVVRDQIMLASDGTPICMRGKPGRKPKAQLNPVTPQIAEVEQARQEHISQDPLRHAAKKDAESDEVLNGIIAAMADEAAAIEFERGEAARHGQDTTNHSSKRAGAQGHGGHQGSEQQIEGVIIDSTPPLRPHDPGDLQGSHGRRWNPPRAHRDHLRQTGEGTGRGLGKRKQGAHEEKAR